MTPSLDVLGPFALRVAGCEVVGLPRKAQALIAFLAMQPDRRVPREAVADLLWTRSGPEQARHSLRQMLVVLRRTPAGDLIRANADALWIEAGAFAVDVLALEAGLTSTEPKTLSYCASRYRGPLLGDIPAVSPGFDEWLEPERARLTGVMAQTLRRLVAAHLAAGDLDAAVESASRLVSMDTLDEAAHRLLIDCLARAGRRGEALQQFETCLRTLRTELDVAPDEPTVALANRIRGGVPFVRIEDEPPAFGESPGDVASNAIPADMPRSGAAEPGTVLSTEAIPIPARRKRWFRSGLVWSAALCGIVAGSAGVFALRQPVMRPPSMVFSGFHDVLGVPGLSGVIAGFGDLVKIGLAKQAHLRLIEEPARDAMEAPVPRDRARQQAGGRYLLDGTAAFEMRMVHVVARVTDLRNNTELWSGRYDVAVSEVTRAVDDIVVHAARTVSQDHDIVVDPPPAPFQDEPRVARELVALGHQIDYYSIGANIPSKQIYRLASRFDKDNVDVLAHLANADIREAYPHVATGHAALTEADALLLHAMQLDPTNAYAVFNACLLRRLQGRIPEAMELCRRTLDIDPRYPGALRELGDDLLESGDAAQAITSYRASIDAAPFLPYVSNAYKGLGVALLALDRDEDAIEILRKSMEADVANLDDERMWLAAVLEMSGRHTEAAKLFWEFKDRYPALDVNDDYLLLLRAPVYDDCRKQVLAALASAERR